MFHTNLISYLHVLCCHLSRCGPAVCITKVSDLNHTEKKNEIKLGLIFRAQKKTKLITILNLIQTMRHTDNVQDPDQSIR